MEINLNKNTMWVFDAAFHKRWLNHIKKKTGASFVGYERYNDNYTIKVKGVGEETFFIEVSHPSEITAEDYKEMAQQIKEHHGKTV